MTEQWCAAATGSTIQPRRPRVYVIQLQPIRSINLVPRRRSQVERRSADGRRADRAERVHSAVELSADLETHHRLTTYPSISRTRVCSSGTPQLRGNFR